MEVAEGVVERELEVAEFEGKNSIPSRRPAFLCLHSPRLRSAPAISTPIKSKSDPFERHMRGAEIARNFYSCPDSSSHTHLSHLRLVPIFG